MSSRRLVIFAASSPYDFENWYPAIFPAGQTQSRSFPGRIHGQRYPLEFKLWSEYLLMSKFRPRQVGSTTELTVLLRISDHITRPNSRVTHSQRKRYAGSGKHDEHCSHWISFFVSAKKKSTGWHLYPKDIGSNAIHVEHEEITRIPLFSRFGSLHSSPRLYSSFS